MFIVLAITMAFYRNSKVSAANMTCLGNDIAKHGKTLQSTAIYTKQILGYQQCARECYLLSGCLSFNYYRINLTCEMHKYDEYSVALSNSNAYNSYTGRNNIPQVSKLSKTLVQHLF